MCLELLILFGVSEQRGVSARTRTLIDHQEVGGDGMKIEILTLLLLGFFAFAISGMVACGETTTTDEIIPVETSESGEFYPFDEPPVLISLEEPEYPEKAKLAGLEGEVAVRVLVGAGGAVESVTVLRSSDSVFETAAADAASRCEFKPAKLDGKPTRSHVMIPYHFRLD